jgi:hypothetical protein
MSTSYEKLHNTTRTGSVHSTRSCSRHINDGRLCYSYSYAYHWARDTELNTHTQYRIDTTHDPDTVRVPRTVTHD